jgi:hypothetical protein
MRIRTRTHSHTHSVASVGGMRGVADLKKDPYTNPVQQIVEGAQVRV